ncbi:MAG TPA: transporter [Flavobacteriaceae bacterium]|nr:transporter [Flavobacteriaceae bacterium]
MRIRNLFISTIFSLFFSSVFAQYTDLINTNRPGVSEGAFAVGRDVLQLETGLSFGKENHSLLKTEMTAFAIDYTLRYGILREQLEFKWTGEYQASNLTYTAFDPEKEAKLANFKSNALGVKYLIYDPNVKRALKGPNLYSWKANHKFQWSDLIPAVSVFAGVNFDLDEDNPYLPKNNASVSPKLVVATQNNFKSGFVLVTNIIADRIIAEYPSYSYILTLTKNTGDLFSFFIENQGIMSDFYADQLLRGGGALLLGPDLQLDLSVTYSFKDTPSILYGRLGAAYRFDMHKKDDFLEDMDPKNKDKHKKERKNKKKKGEPEDLDLGDENN